MPSTPRIIFFGTPEFAVPSLTALVAKGFRNIIVVTQPDKPAGRGLAPLPPLVKVKAQELGLTVLQPKTLKKPVVRDFSLAKGDPKGSHYTDRLASFKPNLGVCVAYGKVIPKEVLDLFPLGVLNVHPSLLPKYRGPSPIQSAILNGDAETGVTIMLLDSELDHGPVLLRRTGRITQGTRGSDLFRALADDGATLLVDTLPKYLSGEITPHPQDHARATFTKLLEREDGQINWQKPAEHIERLIRAYDLWPGTWTTWKDARLKILRASLLHASIGCAGNAKPGYVFLIRHSEFGEESHSLLHSVRSLDSRGSLGMTPIAIGVNCNPGSILLEQVQLAGKKLMRAPDFLNGYPKFLGALLK